MIFMYVHYVNIHINAIIIRRNLIIKIKSESEFCGLCNYSNCLRENPCFTADLAQILV